MDVKIMITIKVINFQVGNAKVKPPNFYTYLSGWGQQVISVLR